MAGFIDIACNFTHESFKHNLDEVINNAEQEGVEKFVLLCASLSDLDPIKIIQNHAPEKYFISAGIHPHHAKELSLPLYLHQRNAHSDFIRIIKENKNAFPKFVVHCFTGTQEELDEYLELGAYIGLTGWICDAKRNIDLRKSIKNIPIEKMMIETDSPYLIPKNLMDKPKKNINEPKYLPHIANEICELTGYGLEELKLATSNNAIEFFS